MNIYKIVYCYVGQESVQLFMSVKASNEYEAKDLATVELILLGSIHLVLGGIILWKAAHSSQSIRI